MEVGNEEGPDDNNKYGDEEIEEQPEDEGSEDDEEEDAIEEDDGEEEGEDLGFMFESGINSNQLDILDASGTQVFERLEQMEYEALAEKKRKALVEQPEGSSKKLRIEDASAAMIDELMESMNYGGRRRRRKSRKMKKKRRRKGLKMIANDEIRRKIARAAIKHGANEYDEAISLLKEVVLLAPNFPEPYDLLGDIYKDKGEDTKSLEFYMLAALVSPKNPELWRRLVSMAMKLNKRGLASYCLSKAISADPSDVYLRNSYVQHQLELGNFRNAAAGYVKISKLRPDNIRAIMKGAELYLQCGEVDQSISVLEDYLSEHHSDRDGSVFKLLLSICLEHKKYDKALQHIERARKTFCEKEFLFSLVIKEGICHLHLGDMENAKMLFNELGVHTLRKHTDLVFEVGDAYMSLEHYETALKYFLMLDDKADDHCAKGLMFAKVARCYEYIKETSHAISYFYKALSEQSDNIEVRLSLASLLLDDSRLEEAISVLSPPKINDYGTDTSLVTENRGNSWWLDEKIKLKLSYIYRDRGMCTEFIDTIFSLVRESLFIETMKQKVRPVKRRLSLRTLFNRAKVLDDGQTGHVFQGFRPMAPSSILSKAARAKRLLQKREMMIKEKKEKALAAGIDWKSDESNDDNEEQDIKVRPLPNLLHDEEHHCLIIDLCKALRSTERYWEAIEIINLTLKLASNKLSNQKKEELRTLGAQTAYNITDPKHGFDCVKYIVQHHPYSISAWNCYFKVKLKLGKSYLKHSKFLHRMRTKFKDCVAPILINGHQFNMLNQHQVAAKEYLEAYKLMPENPLINLCVGSALINLTLGFRLQNKHQCIAQGLAFLYQNLLLLNNSQEALYNIARAFHHVGLVSLAASYYEKVLAIHEKDYPIPKLPNETQDSAESKKPGYCDLRREAAHNLHLIYKKSGALDLARQVLRDHCSF